MTLADLRAQFETILDRDDCSDTLATTFLQQSMQRIQRVLRLPSMERMVVYSIGSGDAAVSYVQVPPDLIEPIDIYVQRPADTSRYALDRTTYRQLALRNPADSPIAYARFGATFQIAGAVPSGSTITVYYYGEMGGLAADGDENELSASSPDVIVYGALSIAGEYFRHDRTDQWEARYQAYSNELTQQADDVDNEGGPAFVASAYSQMEHCP